MFSSLSKTNIKCLISCFIALNIKSLIVKKHAANGTCKILGQQKAVIESRTINMRCS